jgi:RHS repeat-associated protein
VSDASISPWPAEAGPVKEIAYIYDDLYRLTGADSTYTSAGGGAPWKSPFAPEISSGDTRPVPLADARNRIRKQSFAYDWMSNLSQLMDDSSSSYDRSLGTSLTVGPLGDGPNQLRAAASIQNQYDASGNLVELRLDRPGNCANGPDSKCAQWFAYDWDEAGQLMRARRWDFDRGALPATTPITAPSWDMRYKYTAGTRVIKSATDFTGVTRHSLEVFNTLRLDRASFDTTILNYVPRRDNTHLYVGAAAHVFYDSNGRVPRVAPSPITKHLRINNYLGSTAFLINSDSGEVVERTAYQPYGALETDYRPQRWNAFREDYKLTGKEEDIEVGTTYFGARYYQAHLGRFMSADPLTIHSLGSNLNPYAYVGGQVTTQVDLTGLNEEDLDPPKTGTFTQDNGTTVTTSCSECRAERMEAASQRGLETPKSGGNGNMSTSSASGIALGSSPAGEAQGATMQTVVDLAKSKGLVLAGERIGRKAAAAAATNAARQTGKNLASKAVQASIARSAAGGAKFGGIAGLAVDLATSPGGDTVLSVPVYQASRADQLAVPGADWHANRADAESDARTYTAATGIPTTIDESNTKSIGGLPDEGPPPAAGRPLETHGSWLYDTTSGDWAWDPWWFLH